MPCPLYVDFTRGCIEEFPDFVTYSNFDICESEEYKKCPMYIVINSKFKCKYLHTCSHTYHKDVPKFIDKIFLQEKVKGDIIIGLTKKYCLSEDNYQNCMRYKLLSQGKKPPLTLFPDGEKIHFSDLLLRKKLIVDISELII